MILKTIIGWLICTMVIVFIISRAPKIEIIDTEEEMGKPKGSRRYEETIRKLQYAGWLKEQLEATAIDMRNLYNEPAGSDEGDEIMSMVLDSHGLSPDEAIRECFTRVKQIKLNKHRAR